jgi:hypothetical protein
MQVRELGRFGFKGKVPIYKVWVVIYCFKGV